MHKPLFFLLVFISFRLAAQKITGTVFNERGDLLPYSSIAIKGSFSGITANSNATFAILIKPGTYTLVCQHAGNKTQEKTVTVTTDNEEVSFVLSRQKLSQKGIMLMASKKDPAYAIIRAAIKKRTFYDKHIKAFECGLYSNSTIRLRYPPEQMAIQGPSDIGIISTSESISKIAYEQPNNYKQEVSGIRSIGSNAIHFSFPATIDFYKNNVAVFSSGKLAGRGFISPIAEGALRFYRYKFLGSYLEDGKQIDCIRVIPRRDYEPLFSGIINISDDNAQLHSVDLLLTRKTALQLLDTLEVTQFYAPIDSSTWKIKTQSIHYSFDVFRIDAIGDVASTYFDYDTTAIFPKGFFNDVVLKYDTGSNKMPQVFWDSAYALPLSMKNVQNTEAKDSLFEIQKEPLWSRVAVDSLKKKQGPLKWYGIFFKGYERVHYGTAKPCYDWGVQPLIPPLEYNPAEGVVMSESAHFIFDLKKWGNYLSISPNVRYGINNTHLNPWIEIKFKTKKQGPRDKLKWQTLSFSGGKRVSEFNKENVNTPYINTLGTLLYGENTIKSYENYFGNIDFAKRYENGFRFGIDALYEDRIPLNNTTDFTLFKRDSIYITPNYPYQKISAQFTRYKAVVLSIDASYTPGQRYIEYPNKMIPINSKFPSFSINYTKGIKSIFGSVVDFDKWKFMISDNDVNFRLAGLLKYNIGIGGFLNTKTVYIQDYQHFNDNRAFTAAEYVNSFQLAQYYANSTTASLFTFGHIEHHFNGLITNLIPFFNRLNWNLVVGSNALYVDKTNNYIEGFAGIENIFRVFRVDLVAAKENGKSNIMGVVIGFSGLFGKDMSNILTDKNPSLLNF